MPLAEKGVRGKGRQPLSPHQHSVAPSAMSARSKNRGIDFGECCSVTGNLDIGR